VHRAECLFIEHSNQEPLLVTQLKQPDFSAFFTQINIWAFAENSGFLTREDEIPDFLKKSGI